MGPSSPASATPPPNHLVEIFDRTAAAHADAVAIDVPPSSRRDVRQTFTYGQIQRESTATARALRPFVTGECIVAILLPRDSRLIYVAELGVLRAGAAYTALDPSFPDERLRFVFSDARPAALLTDEEGRTRAVACGFDATRIILVSDVTRGAAPPHAPTPAPPWLGPTSLAYVVYTSGTTGNPKGVMIEHGSAVNLVTSDLDYFRLGAGARVAQGSSAAYDSSVEETWLALGCGGTVVVMDDEAARLGPDLEAWLRRERVSVFCPPPTQLRSMGAIDPARSLPDLRLLYVGGEALPRDVADRWAPGRWLENGYGPTECTVTVVRGRIQAGAPIIIGRPVRGNHAWILDESLSDVPAGQVGELCIGGAGLSRGYLNRPDLDARAFTVHARHGRIYRTGDLARVTSTGDLECLGRIDSQVKVRGYRIELEAIDHALVACDGVRAAASRVQNAEGDSILVGYVVPAIPRDPPDPARLKDALRERFPDYMVPSRFMLVSELPTTPGGKLDRRALPDAPAPIADDGAPAVLPRDELERRITQSVQTALRRPSPASIDADFFHDLGGDSLGAALLVSALRADPQTASLTVRDVYDARSVARLAARARALGPVAATAPMRRGKSQWRPVLVSVGQASWLLVRLVVGSAVLYWGAMRGMPWVVDRLGPAGALLLTPVAALAWLPIHVALATRTAALAKRILIGRYEPRRERAWGGFYLRHWLVQQVVRPIPVRILQGTVFFNWVLRALGADVGRRVHIHRGVDMMRGGWDLLTIGDDAAIAQDAAVRLVDYDDGDVVVGAVTVGAGSVIETRASVGPGTCVGEGATLCALSSLPAGGRIPATERWDGVPAHCVGHAHAPAASASPAGMNPTVHGLLLVASRALVRGLVFYAPLALVMQVAMTAFNLTSERVTAYLTDPSLDPAILSRLMGFAFTDVILSLLARAAICRLMGRVRPGSIGRWSPAYVRVLLKTELVESAGDWISGTMFWPIWLRAAGMHVGADCEVSTIIDVVPEMVGIADGCFLADGIYLGGARVERSVVTLAPTRLGRDSFIGNHAVIPAGADLPDGILVGLSTVADASRITPGSSWFGHPAMELPKREIVIADRAHTHSPGVVRYVTRLVWESLRVTLPVVPISVGLLWFEALARCARTHGTAIMIFVAAPIVTLLAAGGLCAFVIALKWFLLGRVKPGQHVLWSCWCSRWDFLYVAWNFYVRGILSALEGTLILPWVLRASGCRIGRRVLLGSGFAQVVDPDMLVIEDDATVTGMFQAHTFEDRVLKIDRVTIRRGATVGSGAVLFYGADVGEGATVAMHGVVMKHERLLPGVTYCGCPTRPVKTPPRPQP